MTKSVFGIATKNCLFLEILFLKEVLLKKNNVFV